MNANTRPSTPPRPHAGRSHDIVDPVDSVAAVLPHTKTPSANCADSANSPDATVIALCHELRAIEDRVNAIFAEPADDADPDGFEDRREAMIAALQDYQHALAGRIMASRAETPDAITAIALALAVHAGHGGYSLDLDPDTTSGRLITALLRETLRLHGQPVPAKLAAGEDVASDDAELIALCAEFDALERQVIATDSEEAAEPLKQPQRALLDRICAMRATTLAGFIARARTLALWAGDLDRYDGSAWDNRMLAALLRDMTSAGAGQWAGVA